MSNEDNSAPNATDPYRSAIIRGKKQKEAGEYEKALESFSLALGLKTDNPELWFDKAHTLLMDRYEAALECFEESIKINPDKPVWWFNKGFCLGELNKYEQAVICYHKALALGMNDDHVLFYKGHSLAMLGRMEEALVQFHKAIEIEKKQPLLWTSLGRALMSVADREQEALSAYHDSKGYRANHRAAILRTALQRFGGTTEYATELGIML